MRVCSGDCYEDAMIQERVTGSTFVIWEIVLPFQTFVVVVAVRNENVLVQFSQAHTIS